MSEVMMKIDASEAATELRGVIQELQNVVGYELNEAIERICILLKDAEGALSERLSRHLDALLDEQLRQVSVERLPVIT